MAVGLPKDFCDGERLRLLGNKLTLTLVQADKYFSPKIEDGKLLIAVNKTSDQTYVKEQTTKFINDLTVAEITKSMQKMSASTGLVPEKVTIKPMTASWGRCISNRHSSINSKTSFSQSALLITSASTSFATWSLWITARISGLWWASSVPIGKA